MKCCSRSFRLQAAAGGAAMACATGGRGVPVAELDVPGVPRDAGALSLAVGVCVLRALESQGVKSAGLKWPNDVLRG